jgi:hypothetical protein
VPGLRALPLVVLASCVVDDKGESCSAFKALSDGEATYCPDPEAPLDCQLVIDAIIVAFEDCVGRRFDEEAARDAAEEAIDCSQAVATTIDLDQCLSDLENPACTVNGPVLPDSCDGAVVLKAEEE